MIHGFAVGFNVAEPVGGKNIKNIYAYNLVNTPNTANKSGATPIESKISVALINPSVGLLYVSSWHVDPAIRRMERITTKIQPELRLNP